jgi:cell division protein FtsW
VFWVLPLFVVVLTGGIVASQMKHVPDRIRIYLHPELDLKGKGHQPHQAKIAAGSGQFLGRGIGESLQKLNYLPEARSDYIAAIFAEECGFVGISALILLYSLVGYLGFSIAQRTSDLKAFYLVSILTFIICFQAFLNLGVVSGLLPSKGTNLPFFSHGGSSLLANFMAICMILNVAYVEKREYELI